MAVAKTEDLGRGHSMIKVGFRQIQPMQRALDEAQHHLTFSWVAELLPKPFSFRRELTSTFSIDQSAYTLQCGHILQGSGTAARGGVGGLLSVPGYRKHE